MGSERSSVVDVILTSTVISVWGTEGTTSAVGGKGSGQFWKLGGHWYMCSSKNPSDQLSDQWTEQLKDEGGGRS